MPEVVVIGGGGHAKVLISVLRKADYSVSGYTDVEDREEFSVHPILAPTKSCRS